MSLILSNCDLIIQMIFNNSFFFLCAQNEYIFTHIRLLWFNNIGLSRLSGGPHAPLTHNVFLSCDVMLLCEVILT